jgi:hypothetical protein
MKVKHSLLFLLIGWAAAAKSQSVIFDTVSPPVKGPVSIDVQVGDNQRTQGHHQSNFIITPATIVSRKEKLKGHTTIVAYINRDYISIVCNGIRAIDFNNYKAFSSIMAPDRDSLYENMLTPVSILFSDNHTAYLGASAELNQNKVRLSHARLYYCIKDRSGKVVSSLILKFIFPKPELEFVAINDSLIKSLEARPGGSMVYPPDWVAGYTREVSLANKLKDKTNDGSQVPSGLLLGSRNNTLLFRFKSLTYMWDYYLEYRLNEEEWKTSSQNNFPFIILRDLKPGKYKLQVRYPGQFDNVLEYKIEIEPAFTQTTSFKVLMGSVITALFLSLIFLGYSIRQKRKLKKEITKRTQLQDQITALQARLQPHFIFNSLNSIQGLINKRNIEEANIYISKFGALLHEIIGKSDQTMHPLATEIKQIEYYLQLEQLRFKFQYKITVGEAVNTSEVNIPTMLLQPYVENAIKHGIIEKREAGVVDISIERNNNNLVIAVKDNGKGYDTTLVPAGRGNAMMEERIGALNKLLKDQQLLVSVQSAINEGTVVSLNFINWF